MTRREALDTAARWLRACDGVSQLVAPDEITERLCAHAAVANAWTKIAFILPADGDE